MNRREFLRRSVYLGCAMGLSPLAPEIALKPRAIGASTVAVNGGVTIPEIWASKLMKQFYNSTVMEMDNSDLFFKIGIVSAHY